MLVLMDRDGVLNEDRDGHIKSPGELVMIDGSAEAVADLNAAGHKVVLITNQSAVGRGIISREMLDRIHDVLRDELARVGGRLDDIFFCTDAPGAATERRKPDAGMLREALSRYRAVAGETPMIGDFPSGPSGRCVRGLPPNPRPHGQRRRDPGGRPAGRRPAGGGL